MSESAMSDLLGMFSTRQMKCPDGKEQSERTVAHHLAPSNFASKQNRVVP